MDKKTAVIESARQLFTLYGYKKVSMDEIARESNVTKKTIYTYFKDKESMFKYFVDEELHNIKKMVDSISKKDDSIISQISAVTYKLLTYRNNSKLFNALLKDLKSENKEKCESFIKLYDSEVILYIEQKINNAIEDQIIMKCDAHLTAFIIYKVFLSVMFEYDKNMDEKRVTSEIISILKDGLLTKKEDD